MTEQRTRMAERITVDLEVERHDVFDVCQLTRGTLLEDTVAADLVSVTPGQSSQTHRHNLAETVLYFLEGTATVYVEGTAHLVRSGDRLLIAKGEFHSVSTTNEGCRFLSVQTPPILNRRTGFRDLEERG